MKLAPCILMLTATIASAQSPEYGDLVAKLPHELAAKLAQLNSPDRSGAIGRNKNAYFHVRFQLGIHHAADFGLATKRTDVLERFLVAAEYSFRFQLDSGDFSLVIPVELKDHRSPTVADRASGVAFFAASIGLGVYALETNDWFQRSSECKALRARLAAIKPKLQRTLTYLVRHKEDIRAADRHAPNRLLFDGIAFMAIGKILNDDAACEIASSFVKAAAEQTHKEEGYFIEGDGFDSSYNGVAAALGLRLLLMGYHEDNLDTICKNAVRWQKGRVLATGEITTEGNTRVSPDSEGESFLGRKKDVDVGHSLEAFMLASSYLSDQSYATLASNVVKYYQSRGRKADNKAVNRSTHSRDN